MSTEESSGKARTSGTRFGMVLTAGFFAGFLAFAIMTAAFAHYLLKYPDLLLNRLINQHSTILVDASTKLHVLAEQQWSALEENHKLEMQKFMAGVTDKMAAYRQSASSEMTDALMKHKEFILEQFRKDLEVSSLTYSEILNKQLERQESLFTSTLEGKLLAPLSAHQHALAAASDDEKSAILQAINSAKFDIIAASRQFAKETQSDEARQAQSKQTLMKAKRLLDEGKVAAAGLYFSNALANAGNKIEILGEYTDAVIAWNENETRRGEQATETPLVQDMLSLLNMQAVLVAATDMPALMEAIAKLERASQSSARTRGIPLQQNVDDVLLDKANTLLQTPLPIQPAALEQQDTEIAATISSLEKYGQDGRVADILSRLDAKHQSVRRLMEAYAACDHAKSLLKKADSGGFGSDFAAYYISAAESTLRQIAPLQDELIGFNGTVLTELSSELNRVSEALMRRKSEKTFSQVEVLYQSVKNYESLSSSLKCQEAIEKLANFLGEVQPLLTSISDGSIAKKAQNLLSGSGELLGKWRLEQQNRYDNWALAEITDLYNNAKEHIGTVSSDKVKIKAAMVRHIKHIDTRLVSPPVSRAYSEVYELFNRELKDDQKVELAKDFAQCSKRNLSDY